MRAADAAWIAAETAARCHPTFGWPDLHLLLQPFGGCAGQRSPACFTSLAAVKAAGAVATKCLTGQAEASCSTDSRSG